MPDSVERKVAISTYTVNSVDVKVDGSPATLFQVAFGDPSTNDVIVQDAQSAVKAVATGGPLLLLNGPASLPVAFVLAHSVVHLYSAVGAFDPKLQAYVVCVSHSDAFKVGDLIAASAVQVPAVDAAATAV